MDLNIKGMPRASMNEININWKYDPRVGWWRPNST